MQGIGKSTLIRLLGKLWHGEMKFQPDKDMIHNMQNKWVIELTEMAGLRHAEMKAIKAFTTIAKDTVRLSYGKESYDIPRSSIFIGTINPNGGYLSDTENRRFWMVDCNKIDIPGLDNVVDQLWAESRMFYKEENLFLEGEAKSIHDAESILRRPEESLLAPVLRWMDNNKYVDVVTASQILEAEGFKKGTYLSSELNRIGIILMGMGWEKDYITQGITPVTVYKRPVSEINKRELEDSL
jgi:predicted P-loop ATPase